MSEAPDFCAAPLLRIISYVRGRAALGDPCVAFVVQDPDTCCDRFAGEAGGGSGRHRPWRLWVDLADRLRMRLRTPRLLDGGRVEIRLERLEAGASLAAASPAEERYGHGSAFARLAKLEEPNFVLDLSDALDRVGLGPEARVLDLGCNTADPFALLAQRDPGAAKTMQWVGVDHSWSALARAQARLPAAPTTFMLGDLNDLGGLELGRFDLVLCLNVLHSPRVDAAVVLRHIVQRLLGERGAVILSVPNCHYIGGELIHGAAMKNFTQPDLSLAIKAVAAWRRYLHQHARKVFVTGKHDLFVTGVVDSPAARTPGSADGESR